MLTIEGLNQYYGESHTLWDLGLEAPEGVVTCLMGRNGVGKTTLLKCIMGLLPIRSGQMTFAGEDLSRLPAERRAPLGIGYVPQGRQIFPLLTVEENLKIGLAANPRRPRQIPEFIFELFPVLKTMLKRRGGDLSGGQQQQLAFGRALALEPRLLILDEPSRGSGQHFVHKLGDLLVRLNRDIGLTVLLAEQHLPFIRRVADRFCLLHRGRNVAQGRVIQLDEPLLAQWMTPDPAR